MNLIVRTSARIVLRGLRDSAEWSRPSGYNDLYASPILPLSVRLMGRHDMAALHRQGRLTAPALRR